MTNPQKRKGSDFERLAAELLTAKIRKSKWKRQAGSGAIGTIMDEPLLSSDIRGKVESISKDFRVEAKAGYNNASDKTVKQFTLKKEWLDKVAEEASRSYSIPFLVGKFSGAREGTKVFVVMDLDVFSEIINMITQVKEEDERRTAKNLESVS